MRARHMPDADFHLGSLFLWCENKALAIQEEFDTVIKATLSTVRLTVRRKAFVWNECERTPPLGVPSSLPEAGSIRAIPEKIMGRGSFTDGITAILCCNALWPFVWYSNKRPVEPVQRGSITTELLNKRVRFGFSSGKALLRGLGGKLAKFCHFLLSSSHFSPPPPFIVQSP
ncbi:hypothetical protein TcWFU_005774 [Taenia crassiceps]|uniref:Uncharacterized protein n=1 Tax=Taenia crassiceps TaxID=6207 RepID=A0ABR4QLE0_9CEST